MPYQAMNIPMVSEENVITLIVKCHSSPTLKLRVVVEEGSQHATHSLAQTRLEVVQQYFGSMRCYFIDVTLRERLKVNFMQSN